jgi:hypothetical protein
MNQHDKDNLQFLLTATPDVLKDWYDSVDRDDHEYAIELIRLHTAEIIVHNMEVADNVEDLSEARQVLAKYRL